MVVFKGAKREVAALSQEFKHKAVVATVWINSVLGAFSFNRRLLAWDSYDAIPRIALMSH